jgi:hypothetical protein
MEPLPPRSPDFSFQDQLLSGTDGLDEELHKIILQSRQEFIEQEQLRRQREQEKLHLKECLAVPISRLHLWKRTTMVKQEKQCLHHVLNMLYIKTHPERDDDDIHVPPEHREEVLDFLEQHIKPSKLFQHVYEVCKQYFERQENMS